MAKQTLATIKSWFRKGLYPTETQFWHTWDSFWHKDEKIDVTAIDGLAATLNNKAETTTVEAIADGVDALDVRVDQLEAKEAVNIGSTAYRSNGVVYLKVSDNTLAFDFLAFSTIDNIVNEGTQDASVVAGYEPVVVLRETGVDPIEYPLYFDTAQTTPVQLKDIVNKLVYYRMQNGLASMPVGLEPATTVDSTITPANATVIEALAENLTIDDNTAENIKIEQVTVPNLELVLTSLTADAKKSIYLNKTSMNGLTISGAVGGNVLCPAGAKADLFYNQPADEWSVDITDATTSTPSSNILQSFLYFKTFTAPSRSHYYKLATIKSTGNLGKHSCSFKLFTATTPQLGNYVASVLVNLRRTDVDYKGGAWVLDYNKDDISEFSPEDIVVTYDGNAYGEVVTTIWKRGGDSSSTELFYMGVEFVAEAAQFEFATNTYNGVKESLDHKPVVADGYDFVIDTQYEDINVKLDLKADKASTYTKTEVDNKVSALYKYKGNVANFDGLPITGVEVGWVYNVIDAGLLGSNVNFAWNGEGWDDIGGVEALATTTNNGLLSMADFSKLASITAIFTTALKTAYDSVVTWVASNGANLLAHLTNTNNPHATTLAQVVALPNDATKYLNGMGQWAIPAGGGGGNSASSISMLNIGLTGTLATSWVDATLSQMSLDGDPKVSLAGDTFVCSETGNYIILAKVSISKNAPKYGHSVALYDNTTSSYVFSASFPPQYDSAMSQSLGDGSIAGVWELISGHSYSIRGLVDSLTATYTNLARLSIINPRFSVASSASLVSAEYTITGGAGDTVGSIVCSTSNKQLALAQVGAGGIAALSGNNIPIPSAGTYEVIIKAPSLWTSTQNVWAGVLKNSTAVVRESMRAPSSTGYQGTVGIATTLTLAQGDLIGAYMVASGNTTATKENALDNWSVTIKKIR